MAQLKQMLLNGVCIVNPLKKQTNFKIYMATCHVLSPMYRERTRELQTKLLTSGQPLGGEIG